MTGRYVVRIARDLDLQERQVAAAAELLGSDNSVPFIARYRKEATGGLDEVALFTIRDRLELLAALDKRREAVLKSLEEQGVLTDALRERVLAAESLSRLEDIYLPFRPKRRTRSTMARERGLEPLAKLIMRQGPEDPLIAAGEFVRPDKEVNTPEEALAGARDIIAEWVNEDPEARADLRKLFQKKAQVHCRQISGKEAEGSKYRDYFSFQADINRTPSHRMLAMLRGVKDGVLSLHIHPEEEHALTLLQRRFVRGRSLSGDQVRSAVSDSYHRLLQPSLETEMRAEAKRAADADAIRVFVENLRERLLASPLGEKNILAIDPGFRTGCKVVCLDRQGNVRHHETIYPLEPQNERDRAAASLRDMVLMYSVEAVAVGNGTGGREAFSFCRNLGLDPRIPIVLVNESGASVYSASQAAREEFPDFDVTVRGAVSIGRRLMDPLAELVKIDPKSIGVGQYQHDVDQKALKQALDDTVMSCVNAVGVEVNTASRQLLSYVSGVGPKRAAALVLHRDREGPFSSRRDLLDVPGMGPKSFQQAAGFLRIRGSRNPLDATAVHPESYAVVERMAADAGRTVRDLIKDTGTREAVPLERYVSEALGMPTLTDILAELSRPGRDPRPEFEAVAFSEEIHEMEDLKPEMRLPGVVTNVTDFGAFVDLGVHQDGLVHISELADRFVKRCSDVVRVGQRVSVRVLAVDVERRRISLSMRTQDKA
jgi:uncharacterized protein